MASDRSARGAPDVLRLGPGEKLSAIERIVVLAIIVGIVLLDVIGLISTPGADVSRSIVSILTTAILALFLVSPLLATCALGLAFALSFLVSAETQVLTTAAVAAALVMRLGRTSLILSYTGGFLLAAAIIAYGDTRVPVNVGIYLIFATVAGGVGFALRLAFARGRRLEQQLAASAEQERQAVLAERRWIAGELHDSIAHHLTVISLHVQMLDDAETRPESQEAIRAAARKAMTDLRFVIELADDGPRSAGMQTGDLAAAIDEAREELEAAGHAVTADADPADQRIPRSAEIILARIVRESATNILKHAGPGAIELRLSVDDDAVGLMISSPLPATPRRDLPSSGTGIGRMAERVLGASGEFSAGESDGLWRVVARLPIARPQPEIRPAG
ncbi:sensor histidine kinase [Microbacterium sp. CIAB417]|uniref:sensor histidine kinase n=1 Tax=Microbacterium sp. CIAB417 TaxID=2860287 RepID=UPI001FAC9E00|nr:histidine kinase [Microbacterium sp. CIAB417]